MSISTNPKPLALTFASEPARVGRMSNPLPSALLLTFSAPNYPAMTQLAAEIARRRTFAIISHPDAGKTTLTEKLLLFGGAIQLAGEVKARGDRRRARSDWMAVEQRARHLGQLGGDELRA